MPSSFALNGLVFAADEYSFDLQYTGTIIKNEEKNANVLLVGVNGTLHTNVQIKVKITGPATPKILATDSNGTEYDIAQLGYWGPPSGFPVQGDFTNTTPIKATFTEAGTYTIELSLVDVANANSVITSKTFTVEVLSTETPAANNITINNEVLNNTTVEELPKTGTSIAEFILYTFVFGLLLTGSIIYLNRRNVHN